MVTRLQALAPNIRPITLREDTYCDLWIGTIGANIIAKPLLRPPWVRCGTVE